MANDLFDVEIVQSNFRASFKDPADVLMDQYLDGFKELHKFFQLMGPIFSKASSTIKANIDILESLRKQENRNRFETFATMLEFEKSTELLNKKEYVSGSRALLRLHWSLDFSREFLYRVSQLEPHEKTIAACQTAYNQTLAKHHPWLVRKAATLSMYAMPTREQLLNKVCSNVDRTLEVLPDVLSVVKDVFDRTEQLYTDHDLHALP